MQTTFSLVEIPTLLFLLKYLTIFQLHNNTGDGQIASIGSVLTDPFKVKVVDQFGNGVAHYPLYFHQVLNFGY